MKTNTRQLILSVLKEAEINYSIAINHMGKCLDGSEAYGYLKDNTLHSGLCLHISSIEDKLESGIRSKTVKILRRNHTDPEVFIGQYWFDAPDEDYTIKKLKECLQPRLELIQKTIKSMEEDKIYNRLIQAEKDYLQAIKELKLFGWIAQIGWLFEFRVNGGLCRYFLYKYHEDCDAELKLLQLNLPKYKTMGTYWFSPPSHANNHFQARKALQLRLNLIRKTIENYA